MSVDVPDNAGLDCACRVLAVANKSFRVTRTGQGLIGCIRVTGTSGHSGLGLELASPHPAAILLGAMQHGCLKSEIASLSFH